MTKSPCKIICIGLLLTQIAFTSQMVQAAEDDVTIVPDSISNIMSDIDMSVRLATKPNTAPCFGENCDDNQLFDSKIAELGSQLADSAYQVYPTLHKRVPQFTFTVIDKTGFGSASNGGGKIVLFRGLQQLQIDDETLSFIIAREMGHVIGRHHSKNTTTKLAISALASIVFPAVAIIGASSAAAQATTATTLLTSAASTATSLVGSEVAISKMKPTQLIESDEIAITLMNQQNWSMSTVASILQLSEVEQNSWTSDLQTSSAYLQQIVEKETAEIAPLEEDGLQADFKETVVIE